MAKSGMYYHGKELLECEIEKMSPEQKDVMLLETRWKIGEELHRNQMVELTKASMEFTRDCVNKVAGCFRQILSDLYW